MATDPSKMAEAVARLEALLFVHGEPLMVKKVEKLLGMSGEEASEILGEYAKRLSEDGRGLTLVRGGDRVQLATKPEFHEVVEGFVKSELSEDLTPASLETLALVAYFGPLSRSDIEYHRGVNSSFILRSLLLRGLVERSPHPTYPNSYVYAPSFELLRYLGVARKEDLPEYEKFKSLLSELETRGESAEGTEGGQ